MLQESEIEAFLAYMQKNCGASVHTIEAYKRALYSAQKFTYEEIIDNVRRFDITPYRLQIATLARKSIAQKISALRSFFEYLKLMGNKVFIVGDDSIKTPQTLPKPANAEAITEALSLADAEQKLLMLLMYGMGLRFFEAANLELKDISAEWIRINGKGGKTRELPMLGILKEALDAYILQYAPKNRLFEKDDLPLSLVSLRYRLMKTIDKTSKRFTPHQLRHAFATTLINNGARINDVSEALGHAELATTKIYTKLAASSKLRDYQKAHPLCKA